MGHVKSNSAPKLSKFGYFSLPSISELEAMSAYERSQVANFKVWREGYGMLEWQTPVDLNGQNLDRDVSIEHGKIAVYDRRINGTPREQQPNRKEGLNDLCIVTL